MLEHTLEQFERKKAGESYETPVLDPSTISKFYSAITQDVPGSQAGNFVNALIQKSYEAGNNDFELEGDKKVAYLADQLTGTPDRLLKITVKGPLDMGFGYGALHCKFILERSFEDLDDSEVLDELDKYVY